MPLARIITRSPEHTSALSQQLQLEGYSVEVTSPEEIHTQPADLEIEFALSNSAEALQRASRYASELGADLVVASGVLELAAQPTPVAPVELQPAEVLGILRQPEAQAIPVEVMSTEPIPAELVAIQSAEEEISHELPPYNQHFARNLGGQLREALAALGASAAELRKRLAEHLRSAVASTRSGIATLTSEYQERARQKAAEKQAEQERAAVASLQAEAQQLPHVDVPQQQPELVAAAAEPLRSPVPIAADPVAASPTKIARKRRAPLQLRGIFTGAAAASALFIVGMVLANVHQQSPLPASMTHTSIEQHVPFGAIIVQGTPAQSKVTVAQPKIVTPPPQPQPRESSQTTGHKKPHPYQRRAAARDSDNDVTVDDVTVRHFPAAPTRRPIQQQAKFKRYSDLD
ncbi:MAG TPA: hypothetical protein VG649_21635 [Candidatus Angelobacter sp.]|nr:hypothetical protein [Candidatus Angelobacter sp.]